MEKKNDLLILVSKTSGGQTDIVPELREILQKYKKTFKIKQIKIPPEASEILKKQSSEYGHVAVYGGDGTTIAAIKSLAGSSTKLLILPGGTANVVSAELNLPPSALDIVQLFCEGKLVQTDYDLAEVSGEPFVLDMHSGWWTEVIKDTPRNLKKRFGAIAYGMIALKKLPQTEKQDYSITVDGKLLKFRSLTTLVANHGFQNFLGIPIFPRQHRDGIVQVAAVENLNPLRIFIWLLARSFGVRRNVGGAVRTYRGHRLVINKAPNDFVYDDASTKIKLPLKIVGGRFSTSILVLPTKLDVSNTKKIIIKTRLLVTRFVERVRNLLSGRPSFEYTRIAPHLFVGGAYRKNAYNQFKNWNVTGIVNMRSSLPSAAPKGFEILHLKTRDWSPPTLKNLNKGVKFIEDHIKKNEGVYVHCRQGEGRGPTMAAAYLISQGLSTEEALRHITKFRPVSHPNRAQVRQLSKFQQSYLDK